MFYVDNLQNNVTCWKNKHIELNEVQICKRNSFLKEVSVKLRLTKPNSDKLVSFGKW